MSAITGFTPALTSNCPMDVLDCYLDCYGDCLEELWPGMAGQGAGDIQGLPDYHGNNKAFFCELYDGLCAQVRAANRHRRRRAPSRCVE